MKELKEEVIRYCQLMDQKGWVANHDGNVSVRLDGGTVLITPSGRAKRDLTPADLLEVDQDGNVISGTGKPFSEFVHHLKAYESRPGIRAVVHSHSPNAAAVGCADKELRTWGIPEAVVSLGPGIPTLGLGLPGSEHVLAEVSKTALHYHAWLMSGNGVYAVGDHLEQAFLRMELVEHVASIFLKSQGLGGPKELPPSDVSQLLSKREKAGLALPNDPERPHWFPS